MASINTCSAATSDSLQDTTHRPPAAGQDSAPKCCVCCTGATGRFYIFLKNIFKKPVDWVRNFTLSKYFIEELRLTAFILGLFSVCAVLMVTSQMLSDWRFNDYITDGEAVNVPLIDQGFKLLPNWEETKKLPDYFIMGFIVLTLLFNIVYRDRKANYLKYGRLILLRRILFVLTCVYFLRCFCFFVTTLPSPRYQCVLQYPSGNWTNYISLGIKMITGDVAACTDNIFSGHTSVVIICLLTFHLYQSNVWIIVGAYLLAIATIFTIISTRLHYSVDVLVGIIVASSFYLSYHYLLVLALDDVYFIKKMGHAPDTMIGFSWQERNKLMQTTKRIILRTISWVDGVKIRFRYSPSHLILQHRIQLEDGRQQAQLLESMRSIQTTDPLYPGARCSPPLDVQTQIY